MANYADSIFKNPETGKLYSLVNGIAREFTDQQAAAALNPNAQTKTFGEGTAGYQAPTPQKWNFGGDQGWGTIMAGGGGGTTGGAWDTANFKNTFDSYAAQNAPQGATQQNISPYTNPNATSQPTGFSIASASGTPSNNPYASVANAGQFKSAFQTVNGRAPTDQEVTNFLQNRSTTPVNTNNGITMDSLQKANNISLPGINNGNAAQANGMIAGANTTLSEIIKQLTPTEKSAAEQKQQTLLDQMASLVGQQAQKAADQLTAEQSAGLPQLRQQFADINAQILSKTAEDKALDAAYQQANVGAEGKAITLGSIQGQEAQNYRAYLAQKNANAAAIGLLQARALGLQGQVATAQDTVNRAVDLKYQTIQNSLDVYRAQLEALTPQLNKEERVLQQAQTVLLQQRQQQIEDAKNNEKQIQNLMLEAAKSGVTDNNLLNAISSAKTYTQALQLATPAIAKVQKQSNDLDIAYKQAQIANIRSQISDRASSGSGSAADPATILAYAQQYAASGQIPTGIPKGSFGVISQVAKELPKPTGTLVDINTGVKPSKLNEGQMSGITALFDVVNKAQELKELDKNRIGGIIPGILGKITGSQAQSQYLSTRNEIVDLLARARSGAALTQTELNQYENKLPGRFSEPFGLGTDSQVAIDNFIKSIRGSLNSKLQLNGVEIIGYDPSTGNFNIPDLSQFEAKTSTPIISR